MSEPLTAPDESATTKSLARPQWKRDTALFLSGQAISLFGSMIVQYAVMWYLTLTTQNGTVIGLSMVFGFLPQALISIFGGVWADRHNRKLLIMGADAVIALTTLGLAAAMLSGVTDLWLIFGAMAIRSAGAGIQSPAVGALVPQLVPPDKLLTINGIHQSIQSGMMLAAPPLAALLYTSIPIGAVFLVDVVTAAIGIGILALVPIQKVIRSTERGGYFVDLTEGISYVRRHAVVRWTLTLFAVVMVLAAAPSALTPLMMVRTFGGSEIELMVLELCFSVGMMLAGATVGMWGKKVDRTLSILISCAVFGALSIGMGFATNVIVFYGLMFVVGLAVVAFSTPLTTLLQETVEPERQGRVFGVLGIVQALAIPLGMAAFGPLADAYSVEIVLVAAGALTVLATTLAFVLPAGRRATQQARQYAAASPTSETDSPALTP